MLTKLTLGEKLKDLRIAKGYKSTEHLASSHRRRLCGYTEVSKVN